MVAKRRSQASRARIRNSDEPNGPVLCVCVNRLCLPSRRRLAESGGLDIVGQLCDGG